jgi:hypothetical protein
MKTQKEVVFLATHKINALFELSKETGKYQN